MKYKVYINVDNYNIDELLEKLTPILEDEVEEIIKEKKGETVSLTIDIRNVRKEKLKIDDTDTIEIEKISN